MTKYHCFFGKYNINIIMKPIKVQNLDRINSNYFQLVVFICDSCNFNCKYCYNEKPRTGIQLDLNNLFDYICFLRDNINQCIEINILGGEPTLHNDFVSFCKKISHIDKVSILIYSNCSQSKLYYERLLNLNNIRFDLSYHTLNGKRNDNYIKNIIYLANIGYERSKLNITLMIENHDSFNDIKKINQIFMKMGIYKKHNIDYRLVRNTSNTKSIAYYSDTELSYFKDKYVNFNNVKTFEVLFDNNETKQFSIEEFDLNTICYFNNWNCNAGKESMYVHCDGNVYACQSQYVEGNSKMFNIYQQFEFPNKTSMKCNCKSCRIDCEVTKWK